jgi:hypothetical protein
MLRKLKSLERGQIFSAGGFKWLVVEHKQEGTLVLMETCLKNTPFDEDGSNDWRRSSIRRYLNENFLRVLEDNGLGSDSIVETEIDLTSDDGLKDYGTSRDKIFLLTADMYRRNRDVIKPIGSCWWLITPHSTSTSGYTSHVRCVYPNGSLGDIYAKYGYGLRPALILKSDILVYTKEDREYFLKHLADCYVRFAKSTGISTEQLISMMENAAKEKEGDERRN